MIPSGVQVFVAFEPVDMRWSFDRLACAALERVGYEARSGALFIYFGNRRDAVKILFFDGSGMCLFYKRLDSGGGACPWTNHEVTVAHPCLGVADRRDSACFL